MTASDRLPAGSFPPGFFPRRRTAALLFALILVLGCFPASAQEASQAGLQSESIVGQSASAAGEAARPITIIPTTYSAQETHKGSQKTGKASFGRFAIVSVGAFPFALFYTNFVFDTAKFLINDFDVQYAPWPFKSQYSAATPTQEMFLRLGVSVGLSAAVGLFDVLLPHR